MASCMSRAQFSEHHERVFAVVLVVLPANVDGAKPGAFVQRDRRRVAAADLERRQARAPRAALIERVREQRPADAAAPVIGVRGDRQDVDLAAAALGVGDDPVVAEPDDRGLPRDLEPRDVAGELGLERRARPRPGERVTLDLVDRIEIGERCRRDDHAGAAGLAGVAGLAGLG